MIIILAGVPVHSHRVPATGMLSTCQLFIIWQVMSCISWLYFYAQKCRYYMFICFWILWKHVDMDVLFTY